MLSFFLHRYSSAEFHRAAAASLLAFTVACSGQDPDPKAVGTGGAGGTSSPSAGGSTAGTGGASAGGTSANPKTCPSYADGFLPLVHQPICSNCHGQQKGIPDWAQPSVAIAECSTIGNMVANGLMPPDGSGYALTAAQRTLVADWVAIDCPETAAEAASVCTPSAGNTGTGGVPTDPGTGGQPAGVTGTVAIDRAEWDSDKLVLRLEGTASDATATLSVEFAGRTETVQNDQGRFRAEFSGVTVRPPNVTVRASSGATATAATVVK
jgi:hypothetical protein